VRVTSVFNRLMDLPGITVTDVRSPVFPGQGISDSYATWCFSNHANSTSLGVIYPNAE